jgi:hypothetical protein
MNNDDYSLHEKNNLPFGYRPLGLSGHCLVMCPILLQMKHFAKGNLPFFRNLNKNKDIFFEFNPSR